MNQGIDDTNDEEVEESKLERDESEKNEVPNKRKRHVPIRHVEHAFGPTDRHLPLDLIRLSISGDRQNKWKCTACNTVFPLSKLAPHLSGLRKCRHRSTTAFYCPVRDCLHHTSRPFQKIKYLKQHVEVVHTAHRYECALCSFTAHNSSTLNSHVKFCGKLKCQTCGLSYRGTNSLEKHLTLKKFHRPTREAAQLLAQVKRKVLKPDATLRCFELKPNRPIQPKIKSFWDQATQTDTTNQVSETQTTNQEVEFHDWGGQASEAFSTMVGTSTQSDEFYAVPVEIQTDPIDRPCVPELHSYVQTEYNDDFGPLFGQFFTESASTQTDSLLQFK